MTSDAFDGRWSLYFAEGGRYRVEAYTPAPWAQSVLSKYRVEHAGATDVAAVDQTAVDGWTVVGDFDFAAGGGQSVQVDDNTGEPEGAEVQLVFDGLRFTRLGGEVDGNGDGDGGDHAENITAGCAAGPGSAPSAWFGGLLVGLWLASNRRRATGVAHR